MADTSYYGNAATSPSKPTMDQGKIFVGGLSWQTTEESLRWHFEQYGRVLSVEVMKNRHTGEPRGFAFVVFADPSTVDAVMDAVAGAGHEINHKRVDVKRAQARGIAPPSIHGAGDAPQQQQEALPQQSPQQQQQHHNKGEELSPEQLQTKVFVGGIPPHVNKEELRTIFEQFGPVTDSIIMLDQTTNRSRGFGFITFENGSQGAQKAIAQQPINIHGRNVEVKLATPRAEQQKRPAGPKHIGLRAGYSSSTGSGEYAGLAVAYGRSGWKAGYGSKAFGAAGWAVQGWDDGGEAPERSGFSFSKVPRKREGEPPKKRARAH